jgi:hypothetical protein
MPETVSILTEATLQLPTAPGQSQAMHAITYAAAGLGPRIVYIHPEEDTVEKRKEVIAADIKAARAATPNTLDLA